MVEQPRCRLLSRWRLNRWSAPFLSVLFLSVFRSLFRDRVECGLCELTRS
jgi:hypothetical protein